MPSAEHTKRAYDKVQAIPIRQRLRDIEAWLKKNYPTQYPVGVRVERMAPHSGYPLYGECYISKRNRLMIRIDKRLNRHEAVETLLHEYAHAMTWETPYAASHPRAPAEHNGIYWAAYGAVYSAFYDGHGWKTSSGIK